MKQMTPGERVVGCLTGGRIDRVPFGVGIGWHPWGETLERWKKESGKPDLDFARELGYDSSFALPAIESGIYPPFENKVLQDAGEFYVIRDGRGITSRNRKDGASMPQFLDYPVKTPADWEDLKAGRLNPGTPGRITQDWNEFRTMIRSSGEAVQVGRFPFGVFGTCRDLMGAEELLVAFYDEPAMVHDMMDHLTTLWISLWERVAAEVQIDHIHIWEDMSDRQGSLISPSMVEDFMMPCYARISSFAKKAGVKVVSVDTDGDCQELVPIMMSHGVNMFLPFEVQAGNDIRQYRARYPELGIVGGLDKRVLGMTPADVDREVEKARQMIKTGRYVPGFDHLIPPDTNWELFKRAATAIKELCERNGG